LGRLLGNGYLNAKFYFGGSAPTFVDYDGLGYNSNKIYYYDGNAGFTWPTWNGVGNTWETQPIDQEIEVQQPIGSYLKSGSSTRAFGTATIGKSAFTKRFTISNIGTKDLKNISFSIQGINPKDFSFTKPSSKIIIPEKSIDFTVSFKPTAVGTRSAVLIINSNDPNESSFKIRLTGRGWR
jgi:hypothetical protein